MSKRKKRSDAENWIGITNANAQAFTNHRDKMSATKIEFARNKLDSRCVHANSWFRMIGKLRTVQRVYTFTYTKYKCTGKDSFR